MTNIRRFGSILGWSLLAIVGGAVAYFLLSTVTGIEVSWFGIPIGLAVGQVSYYAIQQARRSAVSDVGRIPRLRGI